MLRRGPFVLSAGIALAAIAVSTSSGAAPVQPRQPLCVAMPAGSPGDTAVINITNTNVAASGYGALRSSDAPTVPTRPASDQFSSVNYAPGATNPNLALVTIGTDGRICYDSDGGTTNVILDLAATIPAANLNTIEPERLIDTRTPVVPPETPPGGTTTTTTTTTTVPGPPAVAGIQAVLVLPSDAAPVADRALAIVKTVEAVQGWFDSQTGGRHPVFLRSGAAIDVQTVRITETEAQAAAAASFESIVTPQIRSAIPSLDPDRPLAIIYEGTTSDGACGRANTEQLVMAMENCKIYPSTTATFPFGMTYLLAHELTHLLGAVPGCAPNQANGGHVNDSNRDILYSGSERRDWENLALDVGNDDYFRHTITGCSDIDDNPLLGTG